MSKKLYDTAYSVLALGGPMMTMKMEGLVYYTQVEYLKKTGKYLFPENFQAWTVGPVVWKLFKLHRGMYVTTLDDFQQRRPQMRLLKEFQLRFVRNVVADYGKLTLQELHKQFSQPDTLWTQARGSLKTDEPATEANMITKRMLRSYYLD